MIFQCQEGALLAVEQRPDSTQIRVHIKPRDRDTGEDFGKRSLSGRQAKVELAHDDTFREWIAALLLSDWTVEHKEHHRQGNWARYQTVSEA